MKLISVMFSAGSRDELFLLSGSPPAALHVPRRAPHSYPANTWTVVCSMVKRPSWSCLGQQDPTALQCSVSVTASSHAPRCLEVQSVPCFLLWFAVNYCFSSCTSVGLEPVRTVVLGWFSFVCSFRPCKDCFYF